MSIRILLAIALGAILGLWLQFGALALVIAPVAALFFLLAIAPVLIETMEAELVAGETTPAAEVNAGAPGSLPTRAHPIFSNIHARTAEPVEKLLCSAAHPGTRRKV